MQKSKQEQIKSVCLPSSSLVWVTGAKPRGSGKGGARPLTSSMLAECTSCRVESHLLEEGGDPSMNERKPQIVTDSQADRTCELQRPDLFSSRQVKQSSAFN